MQAIRTRGACIARQARPSALRAQRRYGSSHDHHHHAEPVNESFGPGFWATIALIPTGYFLYNAVQPDKEGNAPWITRKVHEYWHWQATYEERNDLHTKAVEEAGRDRALFFYAPENRGVDIRFPEAIQSHAARNVIAGSQVNLDHVVEHYKKQYHADEEHKAQKLAEQKQ